MTIKKYSQFLNKDLLEIFDNLSFVFEKEIPEKALMKNYKNSYHIFHLFQYYVMKRDMLKGYIWKKAEEFLMKKIINVCCILILKLCIA